MLVALSGPFPFVLMNTWLELRVEKANTWYHDITYNIIIKILLVHFFKL